MKKIFIVSSILILAACSSKVAPTTAAGPSQADADRGAAKFPGVTVAQLTDGKKLYEEHCGNCHGLKSLTSESEEAWQKIVPSMVGKANKKYGSEVIDAAKQDLILKYVLVMRDAK